MAFLHRKGMYEPSDLKGEELRPLVSETYSVLSDAVNIGLRDNDIPAAMKLYLSDNVFRFSGFKAHRELEAASRLLLDERGAVRPFSDFLARVRKIDKDYNATYLNAEYNFAVSSAQMAAKWHDFEKDGDRFYLQYRTARDERTRSSHRPLDRITLPIDDPFWDEYTAPLGWNCRCQVVQVSKNSRKPSNSSEAIARGRAATTVLNSKGQNKAQIFRFNPGKQKVIFPPKHPYFPKNCGDCKYRKYAYDSNKPECQACAAIARLSLNEQAKTLTTFVKDNLQDKLTYTNAAFEGKKAFVSRRFAREIISKNRRENNTLPQKFDILNHLDKHLNPNASLKIEDVIHNQKSNGERIYVLTTDYAGNLNELKGTKIQILFKQYTSKDIIFYNIRVGEEVRE